MELSERTNFHRGQIKINQYRSAIPHVKSWLLPDAVFDDCGVIPDCSYIDKGRGCASPEDRKVHFGIPRIRHFLVDVAPYKLICWPWYARMVSKGIPLHARGHRIQQ
jgi:hypothetical protein